MEMVNQQEKAFLMVRRLVKNNNQELKYAYHYVVAHLNLEGANADGLWYRLKAWYRSGRV